MRPSPEAFRDEDGVLEPSPIGLAGLQGGAQTGPGLWFGWECVLELYTEAELPVCGGGGSDADIRGLLSGS